MSSIEISIPLAQGVMTIEPVREKRLALGKKVFRVPAQSKRRSSRNHRPEANNVQKKKTSTVIMHQLLLGPTLKRQKKKHLEREKRANQRRAKKPLREWKWDFVTKSEKEIIITDIFRKKVRSCKKRNAYKRYNRKTFHQVIHKEKIIDSPKIRHLARCGGVKHISGLKLHNDTGNSNGRESKTPPPFQPRDEDVYAIPNPGELVSYLWHTRPSPLFGVKRIYRTGILCSNDGTIRFFDGDNECVAKKNEKRDFYEGKFYLNKEVFQKGNFRVRTDLVVGA